MHMKKCINHSLAGTNLGLLPQLKRKTGIKNRPGNVYFSASYHLKVNRNARNVH